MLASLVGAALLMGLAGSPHCVAMCGAGCAAIGSTPRRRLAFQAGRIGGYAALGAVAAASAAVLRYAGGQLAVLAPFWAMFHIALLVFGASLVWLGAQPAWVDRAGERLWRGVRHRSLGLDAARWPALAGALWTLLPCGLLWSAAMLAALANTPAEGALVMASFALASGGALQLGAALLQRLRVRGLSRWAVRIAGLALIAASGWALAHGLRAQPWWCAVPG